MTTEIRRLQPAPDDGLYESDEIPMSRYLELDAIHAGTIKTTLRRSASYAALDQVTVRESTPAQVRGTAIHMAVLEPELFDLHYAVLPDDHDGRTKAGKDATASIVAQGKIPLKAPVWRACEALRDLAWQNRTVAQLLEQSETEVTAVWREDGDPCVARADVLGRAARTIVDLKTTDDASPRAFARTAGEYGYHLSAAWYQRGFSALGADIDHWWMLALEADEKIEHFAVALYALDPHAIETARAQVQRGLELWRGWKSAGTRLAYPPTIQPLLIPAWALQEID